MRELVQKLNVLLTPREKRHAGILLALMMGGALLEMVGVGAIPAFVAVLSDPGAVNRAPVIARLIQQLGIDSNSELILSGALSLFVLFSIKNAYFAVQSWATARYVFNRQVTISNRLLRRYLLSPYTFHIQRNTADLLRNANQESMEVVGSALLPLLILSMEALTVTAVLMLLLLVEPVTSAVAFVILGGSTVLFLRVVRRRAYHFGHQMHESRMEMIRAIHEGLGGIKVTRVLGREQDFLDTFSSASLRYSASGRVRQVLADLPRLFLETAGIGGLLTVAALLTWQGRPTTDLVPTLTLLAVAVVRMVPSFNRITSSLNNMRHGRAALDAVCNDIEGEQIDTRADAPLPFQDTLRLDGVSYQYPGAVEPSLRGVDLVVRRGEAVGIVGPTGAGKTTLVDLILGLLTPTGGRIFVDGVDLSGHERQWQRRIGYVPQEIFLTDDTIRRNVAFGIAPGDIDDDAVRRALDSAQATEFVDRLPDGADTVVGERGVRLSGGQRQRLGIARALYHEPDVLVLDEATSALDHETERAVMDAVDNLRGSRTVLLIAHRLTTVESCDQIVALSRPEKRIPVDA